VQALDLSRPLAFADDIFLQGPRHAVGTLFLLTSSILEPTGLHVTPSKCSAYSNIGAKAAVHCCIQHAPTGLTVAGTPEGQAPFVEAHARQCAPKAWTDHSSFAWLISARLASGRLLAGLVIDTED
jgi:hypothetical protein